MRLHNGLLAGLTAVVATGCGGSDEKNPFGEAGVMGAGAATSTTSGTGNVDGTSTSTNTSGATSTGTGGTTSGSGGSDAVASSTSEGDSASGESSTTGGPTTTTSCTITASTELSEAIPTVGIVTFSTDLGGVDDAQIEFGLDDSYGMTAPVDLEEADYRTLLLGMKQDREYHYQIVVSSGDEVCESEDMTLVTGFLMNGLPVIDVNNVQPEKLAGGFTLTGQYQSMGGPTAPAYIIDSDGDYVWALAVGDFVTGVRMSYDGKYMWINGTDNTSGGEANIHRVTMDGLIDEDLSEEFGLQDHSITVLPDESVIFYGHDLETQCANIRRRYPDGRIEALVNSADAHGAPGACHVNHVEYSPGDDTLIFSDVNHDNYTKITLQGETVWVLGGETSDFTGDGAEWNREHGLDVLSDTRVLFFNNGAEGLNSEPSIAIELELDLDAMTATRVWTYESEEPIRNLQLGDVQRLDDGNTVVAYSTQGIMHEVDPEGNLVQEMSWPLGGAFGYTIRRMSLYGPPPR